MFSVTVKAETLHMRQGSGTRNNHPRIQLYLSTDNNLSEIDKLPDEIAWCSCFMSWCTDQRNIVGTDAAWAKSSGNWRTAVLADHAQAGDIVVFDRKSTTGSGAHVGIFMTFDRSKENVRVLGVNQSNAVRYTWYPVDGQTSETHYKVLSLRRSDV